MTRFILIEPALNSIRNVEHSDIKEAMKAAGLDPHKVDHGGVDARHAVIVFEFGLFEPPDQQHFFSIDGRLYAGNALIYGIDEVGATVDADSAWQFGPRCNFMHGRAEVERAIAVDLVRRPEMRVNGVQFWSWPSPQPEKLP